MSYRPRPKMTDPLAGFPMVERVRLEDLGRSVRKQFEIRLRSYQGGTINSLKWDYDFWDSTALFVTEHSLDVGLWLDFIFGKSGVQPPIPSWIKSAKWLGEFKSCDRREEARQRAQVIVNMDKHALRVARARGDSPRAILTNPDRPLNPLFAFCLARAAKLNGLAEFFRPDAREFLVEFPHYRKTTLGRHIPPDLTG